jgi:hypothetical protein
MKVKPKHFFRALFAPKGYNEELHRSFEASFLELFAKVVEA